jgi:hypothetical protein
MGTTFLIVFVIIILFTFILSRISPFESDFTSDSLVINDEKQENVKYVEVEKIVEKIVEKPIEVKQYEIYEDIDRILELEEKIKELENKPQEGKVYRNIGLELYQERDLNRFNQLLKEVIGKQVLIVTDSSFVLGGTFKDHREYRGEVIKYDIITDRFPQQPIVRFYVNVPVLSTTNVQLNWIFDNQKFDPDFSSSKLVSDYLKTKQPKNELMLLEV